MLGLTLRKEFQGKRLKGTAIELANEKNTGATQVPAAEFLEITYPSGDLLKAIEAIGPDQGRPLVLIGERGQGKSHLMAVLYHALKDPKACSAWLKTWGDRLQNKKIGALPLRSEVHVVAESLHKQRYKFLWDLLFEQHPHGQFIRGKWEGMGDKKTDVPPEALILELLKKQPTAILLDEFQTWFDGQTNTKQYPWKVWAFNFIQVLSEIAKEHPELLVLVVSVRDGTTDAFQQVHRVNPSTVDFKGPNAELDRRRLLLHRLFENRLQVPAIDIEKLCASHVTEYLRLHEVAPAEHDRKRRDFIEFWPFAPHLMQLLEDQVLVATAAQETRDLIRILADLFKARGEAYPVLTAADFRLDDANSGIAALLDSVANQHHATLRDKALRNLSAVKDAVPDFATTVPHLPEVIGALWLRSLAVGNLAGAEPRTLHVDVTRAKPVDDNAFQVELATIVDNSFNIHQDGDRLVFREEENPQAKLMSYARNDRLFTDASDFAQLQREIRYVIGGTEEVAKAFRVIVLSKDWLSSPWQGLDESEHPERWDERLPIIVLPEEPDRFDERLGRWLKDQVSKRRNTMRFLLPKAGTTNAYIDRDLVVLSRAILKAQEWRAQSPEYGKLQTKYQHDLRAILKQRFDRFAVVRKWSFIDPSHSKFQVEKLDAQGSQIPEAIEECLRGDVFVPEDFEGLVLEAAKNNDPIGKLLREFQEPRPNEQDCVPWLGETSMKEKIVRLCSRGRIAINLRGMEYLQTAPGEDEESAWKRMRVKLGTGKHLDETYVMLPAAVPVAHGVVAPPAPPGAPPVPPGGLFPPPGGEQPEGGVPPVPPGGGLFGGGAPGNVVQHASPATSPLNLIGKVESWGIGPATKIRGASIKFTGASGAQLQKLLKALPDGLTYELTVDKETN